MARLFLLLLVLCACAFPAWAARDDDETPTPPELGDLAAQLAPLVRQRQPLTPPLLAPAADEPDVFPIDKPEPSPVEQGYAARAGEPLTLFGRDQIGRRVNAAPATGEVQDDAIMGPGDRLTVTFRGQRDDSRTTAITAQGDLVVDGLAPIAAAGLTFGDLRTAVERETAQNLSNTTVYVSVRSLRQVSVTVTGEVARPGVYTLGPLQTVLDALATAEGVTPNGSMRQVRLVRDGKATILDLYKLLIDGDLGAPIGLRSGDRIMVPVLGPTVAVAGDVRRKGIFELPGTGGLDFNAVLALAGGVRSPGSNRFVKLTLNNAGDETVADLRPGDTTRFRDGDMLLVAGGVPVRTNGVQVLGHVRQPGPRDLNKTPDLKTLLTDGRFFPAGAYALIGVIERQDAATLAPRLLAFSPADIVRGAENMRLRQRDRILFFSKDDIAQAMDAKTPPDDTVDAVDADEPAVTEQPAPEAKAPAKLDPLDKKNLMVPEKPALNPLLTPDIVAFLRDRAAVVTGDVGRAGRYPVAGRVALTQLLEVAGGLRPDADTRHIDILLANPARNGGRYVVDMARDRPGAILIAAQDKVTINRQYTTADAKSVTLSGEFARPGTYDLRKGDTLLDIIARAGGVTDIGYAPGTIFMRESEKRRQNEQFRLTARQLDLAVAGYFMKEGDAAKHADEIKSARDIANQLRHTQAVGRINVEADPDILAQNPEMAILLQPGDRIFVPRRPATVNVGGEVLSPAALQYVPHVAGENYIQGAGGTTKYADTKRSFVVFPDGSAAKLGSWDNWRGMRGVPPGSTIIVPRDAEPLDFLKIATSVSTIIANLAITTAISTQIADDGGY